MKSTATQLSTNSAGTATSLNEMHDALQQVADNMGDVTASISNGNDSAGHASTILGTLDELIQDARDIANTSVLNSEETMKIASDGEERVNEITRSEERRVGKECRTRWSTNEEKEKHKKEKICEQE